MDNMSGSNRLKVPAADTLSVSCHDAASACRSVSILCGYTVTLRANSQVGLKRNDACNALATFESGEDGERPCPRRWRSCRDLGRGDECVRAHWHTMSKQPGANKPPCLRRWRSCPRQGRRRGKGWTCGAAPECAKCGPPQRHGP